MRRRNKLLLGFLGVLVAAGTVFALALSRDAACPHPAALPQGSDSMQAIRVHCYGGIEALLLENVPRPVPAEDDLLVRVHVAGVNPLDWHYLHGKPYVMRLSSGVGRPQDPRAGVDFAGTVEAVGSAVKDFKPGDRVFGAANGAFAEYVVVRASRTVVHMPENIDFEQAAAVPIAAITALQALRDAGQLQPGQKVLINGASGGVGTFAVQIAKAMGAEVTGVSSARNTELVRSLGADHTIDYAQEDFTRGGPRYDLVIDNVGNHPVAALRDALQPEGTLVMVTGPKNNPWFGPLGRMLATRLTASFASQTQVTLFASANKDDLAVLGEMLEAGTVRPVIDRRFPLDQVPQAIEFLEQGRTRGKSLITMGGHLSARPAGQTGTE
ncbi:NAD(P)-dependent alcohol dehydrogenase [Alkalisalibacterium limincola]|nr:NAD(P)-dependent alcohol dehydrogenase [Alkalisalibacterium limincola]